MLISPLPKHFSSLVVALSLLYPPFAWAPSKIEHKEEHKGESSTGAGRRAPSASPSAVSLASGEEASSSTMASGASGAGSAPTDKDSEKPSSGQGVTLPRSGVATGSEKPFRLFGLADELIDRVLPFVGLKGFVILTQNTSKETGRFFRRTKTIKETGTVLIFNNALRILARDSEMPMAGITVDGLIDMGPLNHYLWHCDQIASPQFAAVLTKWNRTGYVGAKLLNDCGALMRDTSLAAAYVRYCVYINTHSPRVKDFWTARGVTISEEQADQDAVRLAKEGGHPASLERFFHQLEWDSPRKQKTAVSLFEEHGMGFPLSLWIDHLLTEAGKHQNAALLKPAEDVIQKAQSLKKSIPLDVLIALSHAQAKCVWFSDDREGRILDARNKPLMKAEKTLALFEEAFNRHTDPLSILEISNAVEAYGAIIYYMLPEVASAVHGEGVLSPSDKQTATKLINYLKRSAVLQEIHAQLLDADAAEKDRMASIISTHLAPHMRNQADRSRGKAFKAREEAENHMFQAASFEKSLKGKQEVELATQQEGCSLSE